VNAKGLPRGRSPTGHSPDEHHMKQGRNANRYLGNGALRLGHQGAKPNQTESERAKSRPLTRQVSDKSRTACLEMTRYDREWDPPPSPALSSQPRTRHAPWQLQFCLSQREVDPIWLLQFPAGHRHPSQGFVRSGFPLRGWTRLGGSRSGKHPAARGSNREPRNRPRGWPVAAGSPLAGSQRRIGDAGKPPHLWRADVG